MKIAGFAQYRRAQFRRLAVAGCAAVALFAAAQAHLDGLQPASAPASALSPQRPRQQMRPRTATLATRSAILFVLQRQTAAWNRGDIDGFMRGYKDSPETTFLSKGIERGYQTVRARYKRLYTTRQQMGQLAFSNLDIRMLDDNYALATGEFHLTRTPAGGGDASGVFSLLFQRTTQGWRILVDHTS